MKYRDPVLVARFGNLWVNHCMCKLICMILLQACASSNPDGRMMDDIGRQPAWLVGLQTADFQYRGNSIV